MHLGVFLPNWIGDVVMATPTLRALRKFVGPEARMTGVMRPYVADVLAGTKWLDERLFYDPRSKSRELRGWALARRLREERLDAVILLTNSLRTGLLAWASGAKVRVGYARNLRGPLLSVRLLPKRDGRSLARVPTLDYYLELAYALGCAWESPRMELATLDEDEAAADCAWEELGLSQDDPPVLLNTGAAFGAAKLWPTEYFGELARRIAESYSAPVLVLCGPNERELARGIVAIAGHKRVVSLADEPLGSREKLPIGLSKACVRRSRLMVTTDSGPRHFAAAFGVPVVTLFGPTPVWLSETHFDRAIHLHREVPCGPCMKRTCPLDHHMCMRELSVDEVFAAAAQLLDRHERRQAA